MVMRRFCAVAFTALVMASGLGASSHADDWLDSFLGQDSNSDSNRYFRRGDITCDRSRDVCYDRYGLSYNATARYLGEKEANRAYKKYGNRVFLFSPEQGVTCDRRSDTCNGRGSEGGRSTQKGEGFGAIGSGNGQQQQQYWPFDD
jgi:hypothetical protein